MLKSLLILMAMLLPLRAALGVVHVCAHEDASVVVHVLAAADKTGAQGHAGNADDSAGGCQGACTDPGPVPNILPTAHEPAFAIALPEPHVPRPRLPIGGLERPPRSLAIA